MNSMNSICLIYYTFSHFIKKYILEQLIQDRMDWKHHEGLFGLVKFYQFESIYLKINCGNSSQRCLVLVDSLGHINQSVICRHLDLIISNNLKNIFQRYIMKVAFFFQRYTYRLQLVLSLWMRPSIVCNM